PHLVRFNERIRLAGELVSDAVLDEALEVCERLNAGRPITFFEITTAAALKLYAEVPADYLLLEVGMGGTFDSTNVVEHPLGVVITPVDIDHQSFLGDTVAEIAVSKAGILKRGAPAVVGRQRDDGLAVILDRAAELGVEPFVAGRDYDGYAQDGRLVYQDEAGLLDLPPSALVGPHQYENAALAVAAVRHFHLPVSEAQLSVGLRNVTWPARLTPLRGKLRQLLPAGHELWLDGSHNAHGAAALAAALAEMQKSRPAPLVMLLAMMNNRSPAEFLAAFGDRITKLYALDIPGDANGHPAAYTAAAARGAGVDAETAPSVEAALAAAGSVAGARVIICGTLYLAGHVLKRDGTLPD